MSFFYWSVQDKIFDLINRFELGRHVSREEMLTTLKEILNTETNTDTTFEEVLDCRSQCEFCDYREQVNNLEADLEESEAKYENLRRSTTRRKLTAEWGI